MSDLIDRYLETQPIQPKTAKDRRVTLEKFNEFLNKPLIEADKDDINRWLGKKKVEGKVSGSSLNQYLSQLKDFYNWLATKDVIWESEESAKKIQKYIETGRMDGFRVGNEEGKFHTIPEIKKVMNNLEANNHIKFFIICYYFGLRRDEARLLEDGDIDRDNKKIYIRRKNTKTDSGERRIPYHPKVEKYLDTDGDYIISRKTQDEPYSQSYFFWGKGGAKNLDGVLDFHITNNQLRNTFSNHMQSRLRLNLPKEGDRLSSADADYLTEKLMGHKIEKKDMLGVHRGAFKKESEWKEKAMREWHYLLDAGVL